MPKSRLLGDRRQGVSEHWGKCFLQWGLGGGESWNPSRPQGLGGGYSCPGLTSWSALSLVEGGKCSTFMRA